MKIYTAVEVTEMLKRCIAKTGTQSAFAAKIGVSASYLHDVINQRRSPNKKIIDELGLTEIRGFAKK